MFDNDERRSEICYITFILYEQNKVGCQEYFHISQNLIKGVCEEWIKPCEVNK
jgi:hypothetical protein